jgi:hypothetical protein
MTESDEDHEPGGRVEEDGMSEYTVLVEAADVDGAEWQPLAPPETAVGDTAAEVARWTATNQDVAEGNWRVRVWAGSDADTNADPAAEVYGTTL